MDALFENRYVNKSLDSFLFKARLKCWELFAKTGLGCVRNRTDPIESCRTVLCFVFLGYAQRRVGVGGDRDEETAG